VAVLSAHGLGCRYSLAAIYAARLLAAADWLVTDDPTNANLFYVPLTVATVEHWPNPRDQPHKYREKTRELRAQNDAMMAMVHSQPYFGQSSGCDHFTVVPRCAGGVVWSGVIADPSKAAADRMAYVSFEAPPKLVYPPPDEPAAAQRNWFSVPYPSNAAIRCRRPLGPNGADAFAAPPAATPQLPFGKPFGARTQLIALIAGLRTQLRRALAVDCASYSHRICGSNPLETKGSNMLHASEVDARVMDVYGNSVFCLQPAGDTPTRKGIFDAAMAGCIPVFFGFEMFESYSILCPEVSEQVRTSGCCLCCHRFRWCCCRWCCSCRQPVVVFCVFDVIKRSVMGFGVVGGGLPRGFRSTFVFNAFSTRLLPAALSCCRRCGL
jgi:hypothetical protein